MNPLTAKKIMERVVRERPELTAEAVRSMMDRKITEADGLLTEDGAAYLVANDLGIILTQDYSLNPKLDVEDLAPEIGDATIAGRVLLVDRVSSFTRSNGVLGKVGRIVIADRTGSLNVVLWDAHAELIEKNRISAEQIVRVNHGYTRLGLDGRTELNVGSRGHVELQPTDLKDEDYPHAQELVTRIADLRIGDQGKNLSATVTGSYGLKSFQRQNGEGRVLRLDISDSSGRCILVLWDELAEKMVNVDQGSHLSIVNASVRENLKGRPEVHVGRRSRVESTENTAPAIERQLRIVEIEDGMRDLEIVAKVVAIGTVREFKRSSGMSGRVIDMLLRDSTGSLTLTLWDDQVELAPKIPIGSTIRLRGGSVRKRFSGLQLTLFGKGDIEVNPKDTQTIDLQEDVTLVPISDLKVGLSDVTVKGMVITAPQSRSIKTITGMEVRLTEFVVRDGTGDVRVTLWRSLANTDGLSMGSQIEIADAYVRAGLNGSPELSSSSLTTIQVLSQPEGLTPELVDPRPKEPVARIPELKDGTNATVEASITSFSKASRIYPSCPRCMTRIVKEDSGWTCPKCGTVEKAHPRLILDCVLDDGYGQVNAVLSGEVAEKMLGLESEEAWKMAEDEDDEYAPIRTRSASLVGKRMRFVGKATYDSFRGALRLQVRRIEEMAE